MQQTLHILAQIEEVPFRLIFFVIVAIIWGISALASYAKKKQNEEVERRQHQSNWDRIHREMRERAANANAVLTQPQGWAPPPQVPPLPQTMPPLPPQARPAPPPPPVFAPTRSIDSPPVLQRPVAQRPPDRKSTRLNSSHRISSRMPSSA